MNKDELLKLAAAGVIQELAAMQDRINVLAREFPSIVLNTDGTIPAVLAVRLKPGNGAPAPNGTRRATMPTADRTNQIRAYLQHHPGATTPQIGAAVDMVVSTGLRGILRQIAKPTHKPRSPREAIQWKLK